MNPRDPIPVAAVVPAAGAGQRFRKPDSDPADPQSYKQMHQIGGRSMLAAVLDALDASSVCAVVAVVNPAIANAIRRERPETSRRSFVINERPSSEMFESIQIGIDRAMSRMDLHDARAGVLVCPGDQPAITTGAIDRCVAAFRAEPDHLVIAAYEGRRGHPVIIPADVARALLTWPASERLNSLRTRHPQRVVLVETCDRGALVDVDVIDDLPP